MDEQGRPLTARERLHARAEEIRAEERARKSKPPKEPKTPAADDGTFSTGQKIAAAAIGAPVAFGLLWFIHDRMPVVWAIGLIVVAIAAVSFIWHAVGESVKRG